MRLPQTLLLLWSQVEECPNISWSVSLPLRPRAANICCGTFGRMGALWEAGRPICRTLNKTPIRALTPAATPVCRGFCFLGGPDWGDC